MYHNGLVRTPIPIPEAIRIPAAKAAVDKKWDRLNHLPAWSESNARPKADAMREAQHQKTPVHFTTLWDYLRRSQQEYLE